MNKKYIIIGIVILFLVISLFVIKQLTPKQIKQITHPHPLPKMAIVTLDKTGFSPKGVTIKVGSAVRWVNKSGAEQTVNSDNYPTNQLHKELNFGVFNNGSSFVYTFTKPGTYGYHNQYNAKQNGEVIVVK